MSKDNHIIFNSTSLDCTLKFRDFFFVGIALQRLSDIICLEHGLSVIERKKLSERQKRTTYPEKKSFRDEIKEAINQIPTENSAKDFEELLHRLEDAGYEIKRGKHISFKGKNQKRFLRLRSLGNGYTDEDLKKRLAKKDEHEFDLLIDIQKKLAHGIIIKVYFVLFCYKKYRFKNICRLCPLINPMHKQK